MTALAIDTALTQIEQGIQTAILEGLGKRITTATLTTLRALPSNARTHGELFYCTAALYAYRFDRYSTAADNGTTVIKPTDNPTAGRYLRTSSTASTGYLKAVELYEGDSSASTILQRYAGRRPCVVIVYVGGEHTPKSQMAGALYDYRPSFNLWIVSSNLRGEHQAATGSQISAEAAADPGTNKILGDLKRVLAGNDLASLEGIRWIQIGHEERAYTSLADRLMVYQLRITALATLENPDAASEIVALDAIREFDSQRQLIRLNAQTEWDEDNYVASGLAVATGATLARTLSGTCYVGGTLATVSSAVTFAASSDTYRDVSSAGAVTLVAVANGQDAPAVTASHLRVGVTVTDAASVVSDWFIAAQRDDYGPVDQIPPA